MRPRSDASQRSLARLEADTNEDELAMIALLCLLFAWPPEEPNSEATGPSMR
jgi:hypothetical protein